MKDPRPGLAALGVRVVEVVGPTNGYSGTFTPAVLFWHHTASARGSNAAPAVVAGNDYHACIGRDGTCYLGGWKVRQAHGGKGRLEPMRIARDGNMTVDLLRSWQSSRTADDTSSAPNQYGLSLSLDNDGISEVPGRDQWNAFAATGAVFLDCLGRSSTGYVIDHSASTSRKVDLSNNPNVRIADVVEDTATMLAALQGSPIPPVEAVVFYQYLQDEQGQLWAGDLMSVHWLPTSWSNDHYVAALDSAGLSIEPLRVDRDSIMGGEFGPVTGELPPTW